MFEQDTKSRNLMWRLSLKFQWNNILWTDIPRVMQQQRLNNWTLFLLCVFESMQYESITILFSLQPFCYKVHHQCQWKKEEFTVSRLLLLLRQILDIGRMQAVNRHRHLGRYVILSQMRERAIADYCLGFTFVQLRQNITKHFMITTTEWY